MLDTFSEEVGLDEFGSPQGCAQHVDPVRFRPKSSIVYVRGVYEETTVWDVVNGLGNCRIPRCGVKEFHPSSLGSWVYIDLVLDYLCSEACFVSSC